MIEKSIYTYLTEQIPEAEITWGKLDENTSFDDVVINFIKVPSLTSNFTPTYFDNIQITVRNKYIDTVQNYINKLVELFQLYNGLLGDYDVWITFVNNNGIIYEDENIVAGNITIGIKYTIL